MKITREVFIDANIFIFSLTGHPVYGRSFQNLRKRLKEERSSVHLPLVIDEVSYVLMVQTARKTAVHKDAHQ